MVASDHPAASAAALAALRVECLRDWGALERIQPEWEALLALSPSRSLFLTPTWLRAWWDSFGGGSALHVLAFRAAAGELVGLALLMRTRQRLGLEKIAFLGEGSGDSDNLDLLVRPGAEPAVAQALRAELARERWDTVFLNTIPAESPTVAALQQALAGPGWTITRHETVHLAVPLPRTWEEYLSSLSRKMRDAVGWRRRYVERKFRLGFRRCRSEDQIGPMLEELYGLHARRWGSKGFRGAFEDDRRRFYARIAPAFLRQGWLDFWAMDLDGKVVASQFGFRYCGVYSHLQSGFDPEYSAYSPGWVLQEEILRQLIADGIGTYDFLGGDEPYKRRWGATEGRYCAFTCVRPGARTTILRLAERLQAGAFAAVRRVTPRPVWAALRAGYHAWRRPTS